MSSRPDVVRRLAPLAVAAALVVAVVAVLLVTLGGSDDTGAPSGGGAPAADVTTSGPPTPTPLEDVDTSGLTVPRESFCELIAPAGLSAALGGEPDDVRTYANGESTVIASGVEDIAHEYGCRWKRGRTVARAWVFAPPVTPEAAQGLVRSARRQEGCSVKRSAPDFGNPSVALTCPGGRTTEASYRGLFGDAWLACSLQARGSRADVLARTGDWCVAVADSASQPPA